MLLKGKKILLIEDDLHMRMGLQDNLEFEGYHVLCAESGEAGIALFKSDNPDLVILDVMLPNMDGIDVCRELRTLNRHIPIIMLSVRGSEVDKVLGLETGADDYMTKPFSVKELLARIKVVFRRLEPMDTEQLYRIGTAEIDFLHHEVKKNGQFIEFTAKEFELLKYFIHNSGIPVSRETLLEEVWGMEHSITTRTVDNHILKLRKKLEDNPDTPRYFITIYGVGYKFSG
ncbi:MAG: response regulator transcription factor [Proteobacteria bacterium]|nr:response regulator transcription factor [Pseudomonadota bacterium]MBU1137472.1 response regulator transcription factor [Pseudomonadota bacterium]MBU1232862.1 response regulator transcription factor [Pseudomonadota bacterium]MBU1418368.1 response regulator transcription factor [Pseudomonadota bacterium]MBU1455374.1 response regulator transcription factor [Pseudomonadota bacterium]